MTLGSLFDGIGGFPLAGVMCGITPVWASEIELFPMKVTAARFPDMKQLGSVTEINGAEIEPVDIITFGSPCQDLSVAGKQLGIHDGQRSNLFFEAVRIIKEMREADERTGRTGVDIRPRFAVWENVPGAFSSNKGADFQAVLEALGGVVENGLSIPRPKKWNHAGCVVGHGWSIAWRVYDAQYWGVPQRRKRIYLIADFGSERAGEILFEREGVRGDSAESRTPWQGTAADAEGGAEGSSCYGIDQQGGKGTAAFAEDVMPTICSDSHGTPHGVCYAIEGNVVDRESNKNGKGWCEAVSPTLNTQDKHAVCYPDKARTLVARHNSSPCVDSGQNVVAIDCRNMVGNEELSATLQAKNEGGFSLNFMNPVVYENSTGDGISPTITASYYKGPGTRNGEERELIAEESAKPPRKYIVRRLTPTECARLQGFPDWWCEGLGGSDSAIYKAYGNGLALPCAYDVLRRIAKEYDKTTV